MFVCSSKEALIELDDFRGDSMHRYPSQSLFYVERNDWNESIEDEERRTKFVTVADARFEEG